MSRKRLGKKIQDLRGEKGYTQDSLARALGVSWPTVSRYERGVTSIPVYRLDHIAELLGTTAEELCRGVDRAAA